LRHPPVADQPLGGRLSVPIAGDQPHAPRRIPFDAPFVPIDDKRSMYLDKLDPFHMTESRTHISPGKRKYLFVYPFVKTRDWYLLPMEKRQEVMDAHIRVGNEFPSVKLNTTYSFGLDDQDFVVAF